MPESHEHVVIAYARFLECQERRRALAAGHVRPTPPPDDADTPIVPNHPPAPADALRRETQRREFVVAGRRPDAPDGRRAQITGRTFFT